MDPQMKKVKPTFDSFNDRFFTPINENHNKEVKDVVETEKLINIRDTSGNTILHVAALTPNLEIIKYLIDSGSEIDAQNYHGQTALMLAIQRRREQIAKTLIIAGADIYKVSNFGQSAIQILSLVNLPSNEIQELMAKKIINDWSQDVKKMAEKLCHLKWPIRKVILLKNSDLTRFILQRDSTDINSVDEHYEQTALHMAVEIGDVENVKVLLEFNARVNLLDGAQKRPLSYLYCKYSGYTKSEERYEIFKLLLDKTANLLCGDDIYNVLEFGNKAAVKIMLDMRRDPVIVNYLGRRAVHCIVKNQNPGVIEQLRSKEFNVNSRNWYDQATPLMVAAENNNTHAVEFLLRMGADVTAIDRFKKNALYYIFVRIGEDIGVREEYKKRRRECISILLHWGVPIDRDILNLEVVKNNCHLSIQPLYCHLTFQTLRGIPLSNPNLISRFFNFDINQRKITSTFWNDLTIFDLLTMNQSAFEYHIQLNNYDLIYKLEEYIRCWQASEYYCYYTILLQKRLSNPIRDFGIIKFVAPIVCNILQINYESLPHVAHKITSYLELKDITSVLNVQTKVNKESVV